MRSKAMVGLVVMSLMLAGCAGAHYRISADRLKYPTSLSPVLPDGQGKPLYLGEDLQPVGEFSFNRGSVGYLYGMTGTTIDLSDNLNGEVERWQGEGIVRLSLTAKNCASSWLFPLTVLPFYPGCQDLAVTGTVVTRKRASENQGRTMP